MNAARLFVALVVLYWLRFRFAIDVGSHDDLVSAFIIRFRPSVVARIPLVSYRGGKVTPL